jgi:high-affinity iron transporter
MKLIFNFISRSFQSRLALVPPIVLAALACGRPSTTTVPEAPDGGDAQRMVALVDYIGGDYPAAIGAGGAVLDVAEYEEQVRFAADIRAIARGLLKEAPSTDLLHVRLAEVEALVLRKAAPGEVARACRAAREEAVSRFEIRTMPSERPRLERARELYAQGCTECHGPEGDADTPRAKTLDPAPARF